MSKTEIEFENTEKVEFLDYVKKKRRWAFFWGALISAIIVSMIVSASFAEHGFPSKKEHIASMRIDGMIFEDEYRKEMLEEIDEREDIKALIVNINSGGGAVYPSEQIYDQLLDIAEDIPVVAVMEDVAASGAYVSAIAADHILAGKTTVTGSIGVISEQLNLSDVLDKMGIETTLIRSSDGKGGISPLRDPTPEEIADEEALIRGLYLWFRDLVGERRGLSGNALTSVAQGSVFTGSQALELGLIDEIGGSGEALDYLYAQDEALKELDVIDWEPLYPRTDPEHYVKALASSFSEYFIREIRERTIPSFRAEYR